MVRRGFVTIRKIKLLFARISPWCWWIAKARRRLMWCGWECDIKTVTQLSESHDPGTSSELIWLTKRGSHDRAGDGWAGLVVRLSRNSQREWRCPADGCWERAFYTKIVLINSGRCRAVDRGHYLYYFGCILEPDNQQLILKLALFQDDSHFLDCSLDANTSTTAAVWDSGICILMTGSPI